MRCRTSIVAAAVVLLVPVASAWAGPLSPSELPADATWVIHVDLEAARTTTAGKEFRENCLSTKAAQAKIEKIREEIGINPTKDLLSITAYNNRFVKRQGVLLIRATKLNKEKMLARLNKKHPEHQVSEHGATKVYTWTACKEGGQEHKVTGAIFGDSVLILSRNADQVRAALDRLVGRGEALPKDSPLAAEAGEGTVLVARGIGMADQKTPFRSPVVRNADSLAISAGQKGEKIFVKATLVTESAEVAQQCKSVVEGFRALAGLRAAEGEEGAAARRVLQGLQVTASDRTVAANWNATSADARAVVKKMIKRRFWGHKKHRWHSKPKKTDADKNTDQDQDENKEPSATPPESEK